MKPKQIPYLKSLVTFICFAVLSSHAAVILSTDFAGRTISGATASNITYETNGVSDPGDLTASQNLFSTSNSGGYFAVDYNTDTVGNWSVTIPFTLTVSSLTISDFVLDGAMFNGSGNFQNIKRDTDLQVSINGATSGTIASQTLTAENTQADTGDSEYTLANAAWGDGTPLTYTFAGASTLTLTNSETWSIVIETLNASGPGNNTGIDSFAINGSVIPEPSTFVLVVLTGIGFLFIRRFR